MKGAQFHHVLYSRRLWNAQAPTKALRDDLWLRPPIETDAHKALHAELAVVPPPDHFLADRILSTYEPVKGDYIASIFRLIGAVEEASQYRHARELERHLGSLIGACIEVQIPFIREGLIA